MSKAWANGSDRQWRKRRLPILVAAGYRCQLRLPGCTTIATQVHHTRGRTVTGDDPRHLVASCASCNLKVGDPTKHADPPPTPRTRW